MIKGLGQQTASVRYNIFTSAMDLGLLFLLLPRYGMEGYFFSFAVTHAVNFFLSLRRLLKITGQRIPLHTTVLTLSSAAGGIWLADLIQKPVMKGIGFTVIYLCLLALMQVINKKDLLWLRGLIRRTPKKGNTLAA
jgi:stage V sporulation protein B